MQIEELEPYIVDNDLIIEQDPNNQFYYINLCNENYCLQDYYISKFVGMKEQEYHNMLINKFNGIPRALTVLFLDKNDAEKALEYINEIKLSGCRIPNNWERSDCIYFLEKYLREAGVIKDE
jgi:hypothetical protein